MNMKSFLIQTTCIFACLLMLAGCRKGPDRDIEKKIYVNHASLDMFVGDEDQITASPTDETFTWESEDSSVATVGSTGEVYAMSEGETNIIVSNGDVQRAIPVKSVVKIPVTGISVPVISLDLRLGETISLKASLLPLNFNEKESNLLVWQSSDPSIATVADGVIRTVDKGYAVISVMLKRNPSIKTEIPIGVYQLSDLMNIALNKPVTVSDSATPAYTGVNAVDGDRTSSSSRWISGPPSIPQWIEIDLQDFFTISGFGMWRDAASIAGSQNFRFQAWIENDWIDIVSENSNVMTVYYAEFNSVTTDKVRLYLLPTFIGDYTIRLYEIEVYSSSKIYE